MQVGLKNSRASNDSDFYSEISTNTSIVKAKYGI